MPLKPDPSDVFLAAFAKAITEAGPDEVTAAIMDRLLANRDHYSDRSVLRDIMESAVKTLAEEVMGKIIRERASDIEAQMREYVDRMKIDVRLGDTIAVVPRLKDDRSA